MFKNMKNTKKTIPDSNQNCIKEEIKLNLPKIYSTDIAKKFYESLIDQDQNNIIIQAPTGFGKTVMAIREIARAVKYFREKESHEVIGFETLPIS